MGQSTTPTAMEPRTAVNRAAVAMCVALVPVWSLSFAESAIGLPFFAILTVGILIVAATLDRPVVNPLRERIGPTLLYLALAVAGVVALLVHPTGAGAILVFSMVSVVGILLAITAFSTDDLRSYVALPLLATSAVQAVIVTIQSLTDTAFGHNLLHRGSNLLVTDGYARPQGTFDHVYEAAILAILAIGVGLALLPETGRIRMWFLAGVGFASVSLALTHSRSAFLGLVLVIAIAAMASARRLPSMRAGLAVVIVAFSIPALMTASIWQARLTESVSVDLDDASSGRITLMRQAIDLAVDHPVFGVGPNRYMEVLEATVDPSEVEFVVHNIPLMVTAELGILAGILFTVLLIWAGVQAVRSGYRTSILFAAPFPFMMFDVIMYNRPYGLLLFAIWAGILGAMTRHTSPKLSEATLDAHHR